MTSTTTPDTYEGEHSDRPTKLRRRNDPDPHSTLLAAYAAVVEFEFILDNYYPLHPCCNAFALLGYHAGQLITPNLCDAYKCYYRNNAFQTALNASRAFTVNVMEDFIPLPSE